MNQLEQLSHHISGVEESIDLWIAKCGVGYNHFAVLYSLMDKGECTQKLICDEWYLPKQTVFNICKEYKEKGWIEFGESDTEKRAKVMRLTAEGRAYAEPIWVATKQFGNKTFAAFGEKKTKHLFALLAEFAEISRQQAEKQPSPH